MFHVIPYLDFIKSLSLCGMFISVWPIRMQVGFVAMQNEALRVKTDKFIIQQELPSPYQILRNNFCNLM